MPRKSNLKAEIASTFVTLSLENKAADVSVSSIAEASGISRKTFYYHFPSRSKLVGWVFLSDISKLLYERYKHHDLVFPREQKRFCGDMPYYARIRSGIRYLDQSSFFELLDRYFIENQPFYHLVIQDRQCAFERNFLNLYYEAIYGDILYILGGRKMKVDTVAQLAQYYTHMAFGQYLDALSRTSSRQEPLLPPKFGNIVHDSISHSLEKYFKSSENRYFFDPA